VSRITDRVLEGMAEWQNRPLDRVYPVLFIDVIHVKIRDGAVANRPIYTAVGVTTDGERDILGLWAGTGGEGATFWLQVLTEIKNRGVADVCIVVCDGLTGLPDAIEVTWPRALTQTGVIPCSGTASATDAPLFSITFKAYRCAKRATAPRFLAGNSGALGRQAGGPSAGQLSWKNDTQGSPSGAYWMSMKSAPASGQFLVPTKPLKSPGGQPHHMGSLG
jgi:hypothetical protein